MAKKAKNKTLFNVRFKKMLLAGILGWGIYLLGSIADNIFAGSMLGEEALAAVEVVAPFMSFIYFVAAFFNTGIAIKIGQLKGEGKDDEANRCYGSGFLINAILSALVALCMIIFKDGLLGMFGLSEGVYACASDYYSWYIIIAFAQPMFSFFYSVASADGEISMCLAADASNAIVNFVLSFILIRTMGNINALGIGTMAGIFFAAIFVFAHFFKEKNSMKLKVNFDLKSIKDDIVLGSGSWISCLFVAVLDIVMNLFICKQFGDMYLVPYAIVNLCINLTEFFMCVVNASIPLVTQSVGSRNGSDTKDAIKLGKKWITIFCTATTLLIGGFCALLPNLYGISIESGDLYYYAMMAAFLIALPFNGYGWSFLVTTYYTVFNKPIYSVISSTLLQLVLPLGLCIPLSYAMGYIGLIIGFAVTPILGYVIVRIMIVSKYKTLFYIPEYGETQFSFDGKLTDEYILGVRDTTASKLAKLNVKEDVINRSSIALEDALGKILEVNKDSNETLCRVTIGVSDKCIRFVIKDNGELFNLQEATKETDDTNLAVLRALTCKKDKYFMNNLVLSLNSNVFTIKNLGEVK